MPFAEVSLPSVGLALARDATRNSSVIPAGLAIVTRQGRQRLLPVKGANRESLLSIGFAKASTAERYNRIACLVLIISARHWRKMLLREMFF